MNVDSLRSGGGKDSEESAEVKIAKVAITNVLLWFCIWTPYAAVCALPILGYQAALTPLVSQFLCLRVVGSGGRLGTYTGSPDLVLNLGGWHLASSGSGLMYLRQ